MLSFFKTKTSKNKIKRTFAVFPINELLKLKKLKIYAWWQKRGIGFLTNKLLCPDALAGKVFWQNKKPNYIMYAIVPPVVNTADNSSGWLYYLLGGSIFTFMCLGFYRYTKAICNPELEKVTSQQAVKTVIADNQMVDNIFTIFDKKANALVLAEKANALVLLDKSPDSHASQFIQELKKLDMAKTQEHAVLYKEAAAIRPKITEYYNLVQKGYDQLILAYTDLSKSLPEKVNNPQFIKNFAETYQVDVSELTDKMPVISRDMQHNCYWAIGLTLKKKAIAVASAKKTHIYFNELSATTHKQLDTAVEVAKYNKEKEYFQQLKKIYPDHPDREIGRYIKYIKTYYRDSSLPPPGLARITEVTPMEGVIKETIVMEKIPEPVPFDIFEL